MRHLNFSGVIIAENLYKKSRSYKAINTIVHFINRSVKLINRSVDWDESDLFSPCISVGMIRASVEFNCMYYTSFRE